MVIYGHLSKHLKFKVGFVRPLNLGDKIIIIFSKNIQNNKELSSVTKFQKE